MSETAHRLWGAMRRISSTGLPRRILVTGSKTFKWGNLWVVRNILDGLEDELRRNSYSSSPPAITLTDGACPTGLDPIAHLIAVEKKWQTVQVPADWYAPCRPECRHKPRRVGGHCPMQGFYRNQKMVDMGHDICIGWFAQPKSSGTLDCLTRAHQAGIPTAYVACNDGKWVLRDFPGGGTISG